MENVAATPLSNLYALLNGAALPLSKQPAPLREAGCLLPDLSVIAGWLVLFNANLSLVQHVVE
ncbi:hypothetical protein GCM10011379_30180 [Filimonas zeae]|uniref:Uncharacterized protein n=1 Tax=Filimonas zeae TaxID=1737353 RepID=A0A917J0R8_9BACT|nr:hypothetical protein GCM10011379_30180 [Filimonas zeae]